MINKMKCMFSRLAAQFLKPTLALLAACIVGGAWAWTDIDWTGNSESTVKYWDDTANWNNYNTSITSDGAWRILKSASITFRGNDGPSLQTWIAGGVGDNRAVFSATEDSYGFDLKDGWFCVGTWNDGELTILNGTHQVAWDIHVGYAAGWDASCTGIFTLKGGTFRTGYWLGVGEAKTGYTSTGKIFVEDGSLVVGYRNGALASGDARLNVGVSANSTGVIVQTGGTVSSSADGTGNAGDSAMAIGVEASSSGIYTISNGTYTARSGKVQIAVGTESTGTLNVHGGVFSTSAIESGAGTATISLDGGTLSASAGETFISSGITMTVGSNGGTIDVGANNVTIAATVSGSGTIIKKGTGTLTFTGDTSGFTGSIINAEGGVVMLPTGAAATAGVGTSKTDDGSNAIFTSTAYAWTGAANDGGNWSTPGNWAIGGVAQTENYPKSDSAVVFFPSAATVTGYDGVHTGSVTIFDNITFTGSFTIDTISGPDTVALTLDTITLSHGTGATFNVPVVVVNSVVNSSNSVLTFNKSVSGDGAISNSATGGSAWSGFAFKGDVSKFTGQYSGGTRAGYSRDSTKLYSIAGGSAKWTIGHSNGSSSLAENGEYHFGQLTATAFTLKDRSNTTLYIGNLANAGNSTLNISEKNYGTNNKVIKEGDATLNLSGAIAALEIKAGTVLLADSSAVPGSVLVSGDGALSFADDFTSATSFISVLGEATVSIDVPQGKTVILAETYNGATGFTKSGAGILELTVAPGWTGMTSVNGGILILPANSPVSLNTETTGALSLSDGRVMCYSLSEVNVWVGGDSGTWSDGNNWSKNSAPSSDAEIVYIPSAANTLTITCTGGTGDHTGRLTILRDVILKASNSGITLNTVSGTGTLTIQSNSNNNIFYLYSAGDYAIYTDVCMNNKVNNNNQSNLKIYGSFSGNGTITMYSSNGQAGFLFYGDTSGFTGSYTGGSRASWTRDGTRFYGAESLGSEDASWQFGYEGTQGGEKGWPLNVNNAIYKFGQLTSSNFRCKPTKGSVVEVGNKANTASTVSGTLSDDSNTFCKVGSLSTCDLTLTESKGKVEVAAGTLNLAGVLPTEIKFTGGALTTALDPSACIAHSSSAIVFDDWGETYGAPSKAR